MSSLIIVSIVILLNNVIWVYFFRWFSERRDESEDNRLREVMMAVKSKGIKEYTEALPENDEPLPQEVGDEILDIADESIPDETIIKALKKARHDNNEDQD